MKIQKSEEVQTASAVVALESTVFSHLGLPAPERHQILEESKRIIQEKGACMAITALLDGEIYLGLTAEQEEKILTDESLKKMSLRDIPIAQAEKWGVGATTVSSTLAIAHRAGVKVAATGGIGGVHRSHKEDKKSEGDVSTDLTALGRYPVGLVSAGAKGFLDLPRTLEMLETLGVPVIGYKTDAFPAFWCQSSGLPVPHRVENPKQAADIFQNLTEAGALVTAPIPSEQALESEFIEGAIETALKKAGADNMSGAKSTPYILKEINYATNNESLAANLALLKNNVGIAAEIAAQLAQ